MKKLLLIYFIFFYSPSIAQKWHEKTRAFISLGTVLGTDSLAPFLIRNNQYGTLQNTSNFLYFNGGIKKQYDSLYTFQKKLNRFDFGYGVETQINVGKNQDIRLPEAYLKIRYGAFELYGGRRKEIQGLVDTLSTMGSYIWSGNALPLPKVEVSIPNYTPILGKGLISIKGNFAHGWFGNADSVKNYWLHQKSLYFRLGRPNWRIKFYGGFNHQVQWGGRPTRPFYDAISNQVITKFGSDIQSFIKMATGVSLSGGSNDWTRQTGVASNEAGNRAGNHLGTLDIGFSININKSTLLIYRQSIYEDGSLYYLNNINDGLNGISLNLFESKIFKNICIEYLNTSSQGGEIFNDIKPQLRGLDNYFNNGIYKDGWTYKSMTIGNGLLNPYTDNKYSFNESSNFGNNYILNNRIKALHFKVNYNLLNVRLMTEIINIKNLGNYYMPLSNFKNTSYAQIFNIMVRGNEITTKLSFDTGQYWKNNVGLQLILKKNW